MAERESVPAREVGEVDGLDTDEMERLTIKYAEATLAERRAKRDKEALKIRIMAALSCAGIDEDSPKTDRSLQINDYRLTLYKSRTPPKIVAALLLKKGVSAKIIDECTESTDYAALKLSGGVLGEDSEEQGGNKKGGARD